MNPQFRLAAGAVGVAALAALAWSLYESQWVEFSEVEVPLADLPPSLDGLRILHLSDFHLGKRSLNGRAVERAVGWAEKREADLVAITGDLLTRRAGEQNLREAIARLARRHRVFAALGNHDVQESRDPFAEATDPTVASAEGAVLLRDEGQAFAVRGARVQVVGVDPAGYAQRASRPESLADPEAELRILLCHFPEIVDSLTPGAYHLVLAGHLHGGQICAPYPGGKLRLEHLGARYWEGVFRRPGGVLYVTRGIGTSFVPFRFFARPEAARLTLRTGP